MKYEIKKIVKNKVLIIPAFRMRCAVFANRIFSRKFVMKIIYKIQKKKIDN